MRVSELEESEYAPYYKPYIALVPDHDLKEGLATSAQKTVSFYEALSPEQLVAVYAPGKWTPKEILQHIMDTERVFNYRAMRFARNDHTELPGYDQDAYVPPSNANDRSIGSLLEEYHTQRASTIQLFKNFNDDMLLSQGVASGRKMSARAAGFIHIGHEMHHIQVIKNCYLTNA